MLMSRVFSLAYAYVMLMLMLCLYASENQPRSLFLSLSRVSKVYSFDLASLLIHAAISSFNIQVRLPVNIY